MKLDEPSVTKVAYSPRYSSMKPLCLIIQAARSIMPAPEGGASPPGVSPAFVCDASWALRRSWSSG